MQRQIITYGTRKTEYKKYKIIYYSDFTGESHTIAPRKHDLVPLCNTLMDTYFKHVLHTQCFKIRRLTTW